MEVSPAALRLFADLLHERTGQELAVGRSWRIETALRPLLKEHDIVSLDRLALAVAGARGSALADAVVEGLLNNETYFFRDPAALRAVVGDALATLAPARAATRRLRIWCAGCSTGQEAYSIAMMLAAEADRWQGWTIDLLGTDISRSAIAQAQAGSYTQFEIQRGLPVREMMRWFEPDEERWQVRPELRARVRFQAGNLLDAPAFPLRSDIILCRNVLLYLAPAKRRTLFDRLAAATGDDGVLMLGAGETVLGQTEAFEPDPACRGLYRRTGRGITAGRRSGGAAA